MQIDRKRIRPELLGGQDAPRPASLYTGLEETPYTHERAVLAVMLTKPNAIPDAICTLNSEDFEDVRCSITFVILQDVYLEGRGVDLVAVAQRLRDVGRIDDVGYTWLAELWELGQGVNRLDYHMASVIERAQYRGLRQVADHLKTASTKPVSKPADIIEEAQQQLYGIIQSRYKGDALPIGTILDDVVADIDSRKEGRPSGVQTGFGDLDILLGGIRPTELVIVGARPSVGKTALAANIAAHMAIRQDEPVLFVSLEQSRKELVERILVGQAGVPSDIVRKGTLNPTEAGKIAAAYAAIKSKPLYIEDAPNINLRRLTALIRRMALKEKVKVVILDYIQLVQPLDPKDMRHEQIGQVSRGLKLIAKEMNIGIICLAQVNRASENRVDDRPRMSDLRESGNLEQDADTVLLLHRPLKDGHKGAGTELIVAKQRNGPTGEVVLHYNAPLMRFEDWVETPFGG